MGTIKTFCEKVRAYLMRPIEKDIEALKLLQGESLARNLRQFPPRGIHDAEFKVFSQWGEDGIIQWIISKIPSVVPVFIEFGVEDYQESNTRFLLMRNNWKGLVIDGSEKNVEKIKRSPSFWRHDLTAHCAFVTRENINDLFRDNGFQGDIGILSIDIDGNDYWIWEAIDAVNPQVVICEYNSIWGALKKVTVPYEENFIRARAHFSHLYYGASLASLIALGKKKGYICIGSNSAGNNVFFVRQDLRSFLKNFRVKRLMSRAGFVNLEPPTAGCLF